MRKILKLIPGIAFLADSINLSMLVIDGFLTIPLFNNSSNLESYSADLPTFVV